MFPTRATTGTSAAPRWSALGVARALYFGAAFHVAVALWLLSSLVWSLLASVLHRLLPARSGEALGQFMIMAGFRWFIGVLRATGVLRCDLSALDALRDQRSLVIAANHPTMLDAVLLISRLPRVVCIAKASLWDNVCLGGSVRLAGYLRNDAAVAMIRSAAAAVREGRQLMIFPEGSRTARPPLDPFSRSFAVMARAAGAPVQTVFIETDGSYLRKDWPMWRRPELPLRYRIRLGERFTPEGDLQTFIGRLEGYFRGELG
jgi:1-acyl-sn-glycerol-3-phosphate acyltransferase